MIRINLTGDYDIAEPSSCTELEHLDAFLAALRGNAIEDEDAFKSLVSKIVRLVKRENICNVCLQVTSELVSNKLTHEFRLVYSGQTA